MSENPLLKYFNNNDKRFMLKWTHYFEIYHRHFAQFRNKKPTVVEIGVYHGGSLQMWKSYFGEGARICGVDIDPRCKALEEPGIEIFIGNQEDRGFLRELCEHLGQIQIVVDDGGHKMAQQIVTFEEMYPSIAIPGVYLVEDLHTSYLSRWGGQLHKADTFVEYSKRLIDNLNGWHIPPEDIELVSDSKVPMNDFLSSAYSMTFYDSVLVVEKRKMAKPVSRHTGKESF